MKSEITSENRGKLRSQAVCRRKLKGRHKRKYRILNDPEFSPLEITTDYNV